MSESCGLCQFKEFPLLTVWGRDHFEVIAAGDRGIQGGVDLLRIGVERELVQRDVAGISARRIGVRRETIHYGAVCKPNLQLLDGCAFKEARLESLGCDSE